MEVFLIGFILGWLLLVTAEWGFHRTDCWRGIPVGGVPDTSAVLTRCLGR